MAACTHGFWFAVSAEELPKRFILRANSRERGLCGSRFGQGGAADACARRKASLSGPSPTVLLWVTEMVHNAPTVSPISNMQSTWNLEHHSKRRRASILKPERTSPSCPVPQAKREGGILIFCILHNLATAKDRGRLSYLHVIFPLSFVRSVCPVFCLLFPLACARRRAHRHVEKSGLRFGWILSLF